MSSVYQRVQAQAYRYGISNITTTAVFIVFKFFLFPFRHLIRPEVFILMAEDALTPIF